MTASFAKRAFVAALCGPALLCGVALGQEADQGSPPARVEDEIVVLGRIGELRRELDRAEEAVYARFNEVNTDHRLDIHCRYEQLIDSHISRRVCATNYWRDEDAKIGTAALRQMRGEDGPAAQTFYSEQLNGQRLLQDALRRATSEDPQLQQALMHFVATRQALLAEQTRSSSRRSVARQVVPDADGLPFGARAMFEVRAGRRPWSQPLSQSTFTIWNVMGEIRELELHCAQGDRPIEYQEGVEWTTPQGWSGCTLLVNAAPATTFDLYEFD
jgi:hypothetical protein